MRHLRIGQVAEMLNVPLRTLQRRIRLDTEFPVIELGPKTRLVPEDELQAYLERHKVRVIRPTNSVEA